MIAFNVAVLLVGVVAVFVGVVVVGWMGTHPGELTFKIIWVGC